MSFYAVSCRSSWLRLCLAFGLGVVLLSGVSLPGFAVEIRSFDDPDKQARYEHLIGELRCLVCQNQSLADSDADLARDLRDEVYGIIQSGQSEDEAIRFLTDRYGDFVLYRPPVKSITLLLWVGPLLIFLLGAVFLARQFLSRRSTAEARLTDAEQQRLDAIRNSLQTKDRP